MTNISAVIVVKDNPLHLSECLQSLDFVDEIVIADIGINAECKKKLESFSQVRIEKIDQEVTYVEQIREKTKDFAKHNHVIFLDPDEVISSDLKQILVAEYENYDYIAMPRKNIIFQKWIQYTRWWPDYQIRLFHKNFVEWPAKLHSQPIIMGDGLYIEPQEHNALVHYNYENITEFIMKMVRYAQSEAKEKVSEQNPYTISQAIGEAMQEFISRFFAEQGYKDGMHGFALAFFQMMYKMLVFFYVWELNKYPKSSEKEVVNAPQAFFKQGLYETNHWLIKEKLVQMTATVRYKVVNRLLQRL